MEQSKAQVAILMGSDSDLPIMKQAAEVLREFGIGFEINVMSAHRTPKEVASYVESARGRGIRVFIAGAGGAAHLAGVIAAHTELPVIGIPIPISPLQGQDSLLSTVQMPKGIPVATVAIGNAWNAGLLAVQILGIGSEKLLDQFAQYKLKMRDDVLKKKVEV